MIKRIVVELETKDHIQIKKKAISQGKTMKEVLTALLMEWLKKG